MNWYDHQAGLATDHPRHGVMPFRGFQRSKDIKRPGQQCHCEASTVADYPRRLVQAWSRTGHRTRI